MSETTSSRDRRKTPNYTLRRFGAVAMVGLLGLIGKGGAEMVGNTHDRIYGTDIPNAQDVREHPEQYAQLTAGPRDLKWNVAEEYTSPNHDVRNNLGQIEDQIRAKYPDSNGELKAGMHINVPTTTEPPQENQNNS